MGLNIPLLVLQLLLAVGVQSIRKEKESLTVGVQSITKESVANGAFAVHDNESGIVFRDGAQPPAADGDVVAIFADYDGCFDFLNPLLEDRHKNSPGNFRKYGVIEKYNHERAKIIEALKAITAGARKVILFVGSNRQCRSFDKILGANTWGSKNIEYGFSALRDGAYQEIAKVVGTEVSGAPWEMNYALVSDNPANRGAWTPDKMITESNDATGTAWSQDSVWQQKTTRRGDFATKEDEKELKWMIVQNNLKQLRGMGAVHAYFFDDRYEFLTYTGQKFARSKPKWGDQYAQIDFHTVKFDYMDYIIDGKNDPLLLESYYEEAPTKDKSSGCWGPKCWGWY